MGCTMSRNLLSLRSFGRAANSEIKMIEAVKKREAARHSSVKTFDSVIMKFPKLDESFEKVRSVFQKFDEDGNGSIDLDELKKCFQELKVSFTDHEIEDLYRESDMDENEGIDFKEFIVLLALVYLDLEDRLDSSAKQRILSNDLREAFDTVLDTFIYFDKDKDGYITKKEMVQALNKVSPGQEGAGDIALQRFNEMDWNKNGKITFKEMLFAFTNWVGVDDDNED